jgi:hypothetical protein
MNTVHTTEPDTRNSATLAPYLPADISALMDTHSVRIDEASKHRGSWRHRDVKTVRRAIKARLRQQGLPTGEGYAVPLYWLHDWLTHGRYVGPRTPDPHAAWAAHLTLISALNRPDSGLSVVPLRRMQHAS